MQLHSLLRTPEHNGAEGEVVAFDASTGRWRVRLESDGRELALRASSLAVLMPAPQTPLALGEMPCGADVEMHSLVRSPELNGVRGKVVEPQDPGTGRCGVKTRLCGNAACSKALAPPLLQCSKCKAEAYCCKACQVRDPPAPAAHSAPYASAHSPAPAPVPPACTPPPPDCRVEGRAQAYVRCSRAGRGGGAAPARRGRGSASS